MNSFIITKLIDRNSLQLFIMIIKMKNKNGYMLQEACMKGHCVGAVVKQQGAR